MVAKPISALPGIIARHARRLNRAAEGAMKKSVTEAQKTAILATRVDEGDARSNWFVNVGTPFLGVIPPYAPGMRLGKGERANANAAMAQGRRAVKGFTLDIASMFLTNNVEYITFLDDGTPSIPPDNMTAKAVQVGAITARTEFAKNIKRSRNRRVR